MVKQKVVQIGPSIAGLGGIETVIRTYLSTAFTNYEMSAVPTWNKTQAAPRGRFLWISGIANLITASHKHRKTKTIVHSHLSHGGSFIREGSFVVVARVLGLRSFVTVHGSQFVSSADASKLRRSLYRLVLRSATRVAVLNPQTEEAIRRLGITRFTMLPNPGPVAPNTTDRPPSRCAPVVTFAGAVGPRKGVDTLLQAWKLVEDRMPQAELRIWGPAENPETVASAGRLWKGPAEPSEIWRELRSSRVAVLPSTAEAMPMFILEAMGTGRPTIVTNIGAMPEQVEGCGRVIPVGDVKALADSILLYLKSPTLADDHGSLAKKKYTEQYGSDRLEAQLQSFYTAN